MGEKDLSTMEIPHVYVCLVGFILNNIEQQKVKNKNMPQVSSNHTDIRE